MRSPRGRSARRQYRANSASGRNDDAAASCDSHACCDWQRRGRLKVLVTGCAGFIGMHTVERLLAAGISVAGVDSFDPYYDVGLKQARIARLAGRPGFVSAQLDLADSGATQRLFAAGDFTHVIHLAAQPGVRYSLVNPEAYLRNNLVAF